VRWFLLSLHVDAGYCSPVIGLWNKTPMCIFSLGIQILMNTFFVSVSVKFSRSLQPLVLFAKQQSYRVWLNVWLRFPYWARFWGFWAPQTSFITCKRHILTPTEVFWVIVYQNPLQIVVWRLINETRRKKRMRTKKVYISPTWGDAPLEPIATKFVNSISISLWRNQSFKIW